MNITVVCDVLGEANNGTTIAALNLIRSMKERGHSVRVLCPDQNRKGEPGFYVVPTANLGPVINKYLKKNGVSLSRAKTDIVNEAIDGADVVHFTMPFPLGHKAAKLAKKRGIAVSAGFHCQAENFTSHIFMKDSRLANWIFYRFTWRHTYRLCDCIHYPTQFIRDTFEHAIRRETPGHVISNGVNAAFRPVEVARDPKYDGKIVIQFTGRLSKEKTHKVLIDAVNLSKYRDRIQLVFAGIGPLYEKLEKRGRKLPNPPEFRFFSREDLVKQLNMADLYVHPAEIEIEAISCLEAIACGLVPVIANSPRSATRYFAIDERNLFHNKDAKDLARRIDYWIEHPEEKQALSERYRGFVEQHEYEHCMDRMEQMLSEAVKERQHG
jgi:glycosyltransferase involved in cell wall biosynthesis